MFSWNDGRATHTDTMHTDEPACICGCDCVQAAEFLVTLCEARDKAPGMMRKLPNFTPSLFETLMLFLLDVEVGAAVLHV